MHSQQQELRTIALKLNASGTAEVLNAQKLYKGSYGFIKLQVYAPKTQNTEAPMCSAYCTTRDELGYEKLGKNYNLLFVKECELDGQGYLLFESLLPKEFTKTATVENGLVITFNYCDSAPTTDESGEILTDENGVPKRHATNLLVSSRFITTVYPGGWNDAGVELDINSAEAAQINENMRNIAEAQETLEEVLSGLRETYDGSINERNRAKAAEKILDDKIESEIISRKEKDDDLQRQIGKISKLDYEVAGVEPPTLIDRYNEKNYDFASVAQEHISSGTGRGTKTLVGDTHSTAEKTDSTFVNGLTFVVTPGAEQSSLDNCPWCGIYSASIGSYIKLSSNGNNYFAGRLSKQNDVIAIVTTAPYADEITAVSFKAQVSDYPEQCKVKITISEDFSGKKNPITIYNGYARDCGVSNKQSWYNVRFARGSISANSGGYLRIEFSYENQTQKWIAVDDITIEDHYMETTAGPDWSKVDLVDSLNNLNSLRKAGETELLKKISETKSSLQNNIDKKMDKVSSATSGNFVAFDKNGNAVDSKCNPASIDNAKTAAAEAHTLAQEAKDIALGRDTSKVFPTYADMISWLAVAENKQSLTIGSNLFIEDENTPDYWWNGKNPVPEYDRYLPDNFRIDAYGNLYIDGKGKLKIYENGDRDSSANGTRIKLENGEVRIDYISNGIVSDSYVLLSLRNGDLKLKSGDNSVSVEGSRAELQSQNYHITCGDGVRLYDRRNEKRVISLDDSHLVMANDDEHNVTINSAGHIELNSGETIGRIQGDRNVEFRYPISDALENAEEAILVMRDGVIRAAVGEVKDYGTSDFDYDKNQHIELNRYEKLVKISSRSADHESQLDITDTYIKMRAPNYDIGYGFLSGIDGATNWIHHSTVDDSYWKNRLIALLKSDQNFIDAIKDSLGEIVAPEAVIYKHNIDVTLSEGTDDVTFDLKFSIYTTTSEAYTSFEQLPIGFYQVVGKEHSLETNNYSCIVGFEIKEDGVTFYSYSPTVGYEEFVTYASADLGSTLNDNVVIM